MNDWLIDWLNEWLNDWITFFLSAIHQLYIHILSIPIFQSYICIHPIHWYLFCASAVRRWTLHRNCIVRAAFMQNDFFFAKSTYSPRLLSFTSTDQRIYTSSVLFVAAERGWSMMYAAILVDNFKFCESNRRRDSSDLAATGVPWHYQCWHGGELHLEHSRGRWDGGGSAGRLPRNSWIVALQTVGWVVFQIRFESDIRTFIHAYILSQRDFSLYFYQKSVYVVCVCMYLMYQRNNVCEKAWVYVGCGCACEGNGLGGWFNAGNNSMLSCKSLRQTRLHTNIHA